MRELPLLAVPSVVRNMLAGLQVEDRRPVRPQPETCGECRGTGTLNPALESYGCSHCGGVGSLIEGLRSPFGAPGDLLYVRERARVLQVFSDGSTNSRWMCVQYEAGEERSMVQWPERIKRPTLDHCLANGCYREAARLWLRVEDVWVERVQDITEAGAEAEGMEPHDGSVCVGHTRRASFRVLWDCLYGNWHENPWIWACRFHVASTTGRPS